MMNPKWNQVLTFMETNNDFGLLWNFKKKINLIHKSSFSHLENTSTRLLCKK